MNTRRLSGTEAKRPNRVRKHPAGLTTTHTPRKNFCTMATPNDTGAFASLSTSVGATAITVPAKPRCWLVSETPDGSIERTPVHFDQSVLNIQRDLIDHLSAEPLSDSWLENLRDYCANRLAAREEALARNTISTPTTDGQRWEVL